MASRKAFLGSLPCLQLPLTAEPTQCQPSGSQTPPHVPLPRSSSHVGGLDPPRARFCASPVPRSLLNQPLDLLLIVVPLSPHRGLSPELEQRWLLCAVPPFPSRAQSTDGGCWGTQILIGGSREESTEPSELWSPPRSAAQRWERGELPLALISGRFLGVPAPGLDPPSAITSSPSRPCFVHELCKNCQS